MKKKKEEEEVFIYLQTKKNKNNYLFTGDVLPISRLFLP